jgi:hypothetical protein
MGLRKRTSCLSFPSNSSNLVCVAEANVLIPTHSRVKDAIDKYLSNCSNKKKQKTNNNQQIVHITSSRLQTLQKTPKLNPNQEIIKNPSLAINKLLIRYKFSRKCCRLYKMCTTSPLFLTHTLSKATPQHGHGALSEANLTFSYTTQRPRNKILTGANYSEINEKNEILVPQKEP